MPTAPSVSTPETSLALVTGASSGIGRAFAYQLAELGYKLILIDIKREGVEELLEKYPTAKFLEGDISQDTCWEEAAKLIQPEQGLQVLVNAAGILLEDLSINAAPNSYGASST